ncbi:hypothetical protein [Seonamhaeicola maritimus]|uniref:hypothetical protein n=1 Tax=Seonamhaeicola maritimus TaxID=2591822 RepID=UPI0024946D6D|nr:hypothetical protein [Seonamhaeicola maritimus]
MKNLRPLILGIIIGALATYFFCPRQAVEGDDTKSMAVKIKTPKDTISVAEATKLFKNWQTNNITEIDSTIELEGSRKKITYVGWSLEEIKDYLTYAESKSDTLGYKMTGIRVYMGNYGKNSNPTLKNRNTLFIVPTGSKNVSKANMVPFSIQGGGNLPIGPLNKGDGGTGGYP